MKANPDGEVLEEKKLLSSGVVNVHYSVNFRISYLDHLFTLFINY